MPFYSEDDSNQFRVFIPGEPHKVKSVRLNNVGNVNFIGQEGAAPGEPNPAGGIFAQYASPEEGFMGLMNDIYAKQMGHSKVVPAGATINQFVKAYYGGPVFQQDPSVQQYATNLAKLTGTTVDTPIQNIDTFQLAKAVGKLESSAEVYGQPNWNQPQTKPTQPTLQLQSKGQFYPEEVNPPSEYPLIKQPQPTPQPQAVQPIPQLVGQALSDPMAESMGMFQPGGMDLKGMFSQQNMLKQLPVAGMMIGGSAGFGAGGPLGPFTGPVGAGLGAGAGEALRQYLGGSPAATPGQQAMEVGKSMATGATAEMGGQSLGKVAGAVLSPFANRVAQRMAENPSVAEAQKLVEQGAQISPSEIAGTRTARFFEGLAEKVWPASAKMAKSRQSLQQVAEGLKDEFVASRGLYDTSKQGVSQAWDNWVNAAGGPDATYAMPKTTEVLKDAMGKPFAQMGAFWKKHAATFASEAEGGQVTVQGIRDLFNTLSATSVKGAERTARMKIADAIMEDLASSGNPEMVSALGQARELSFMNRIAGPLRAIFDKSMTQPQKAGEVMEFNPDTFVNLWNQRRGNFLSNKNYSPEDIAVIDKFADKMRALTGDLKRGASSPSLNLGGITQLNLQNPLAVGAAVYKYPAVSVPVAADWFLARSLMSPNGLMRKFLTTGIKPPTLPLKIGIMEGVQND